MKSMIYCTLILLFAGCNDSESNRLRFVISNNSPFCESAEFSIRISNKIIWAGSVEQDLTLHNNTEFEILSEAKKGELLNVQVNDRFNQSIKLLSDSFNYVRVNLYNRSPFQEIANQNEDSLNIKMFSDEQAKEINYFGNKRWK